MRSRAFLFGSAVFLLALGIDVEIMASGSYVLGILSCVGTLLVFSSGFIWFVSHDDPSLHMKGWWVCFPLLVFGYGTNEMLKRANFVFLQTPENLDEIGKMLMTKFQIALWLISIIILTVFVAAGSLMVRRR